MIIVYGTSNCGKVAQCGSSYVSTQFFHIFWIPLIPLGSQLVFDDRGGSRRGIKVALHGASVLAAYGRVWTLLVTLFAVCSGSMAVAATESGTCAVGAGAGFGVLALLSILCAVAAFVRVGRLSPDQRAQHGSYARFVGFPVDVALLGDLRAGYRERLLEEVVRKGKLLAPSSYREGFHAESQWAEIAAHPHVTDVDFLDAALTLARIDWSLAERADRPRLGRAHAEIWSKLKSALRTQKPAEPARPAVS